MLHFSDVNTELHQFTYFDVKKKKKPKSLRQLMLTTSKAL
jgi:hypothetical protein